MTASVPAGLRSNAWLYTLPTAAIVKKSRQALLLFVMLVSNVRTRRVNYGDGEGERNKFVELGTWTSSTPGLRTAAMNAYERRREENIRKNNQLLAQLGLDAVKHALEPGPVRLACY